MSCRDKSVALELIALKKPTALDELINSIPKPKGATPNFGLPRWKVMPLESKIPMIPGPKGSYHFTRNKIGRKLWVGSADAQFDLSDPYNYEAEWIYDPLHDEHLKKFFLRPINIKRMMKIGLVTKKLDAKCSVKDYNMYRKYLKKLYNDSINLEIKHRASMDLERKTLYFTEKLAEKDVERMKAREKRMEATSLLLEKNRLEDEEKMQKQKERQIKIEQRLRDLKFKKIQDKKMRIQKAWEEAEILRRKHEAAAYIERQKIVKTLKRWRDSECQRKTARVKRKLQEKQAKQTAVEEKWRLRQEMQRKQIERENFLQHCSIEERAINIKAYDTKVDRERARMQRMGEQYKMFMKCYASRHVAGQRDGMCCIKRHRKHKMNGKGVINSCSGKTYKHKNEKLNEEVKVHIKKKQKKGKCNKKKRILEPSSEPEPEEICTGTKTPFLRINEQPVLKDKCECEKVKAEWLQRQQISI
ncbi:golgin subfamily A member 6-like protein 7 isoform X1 [Neodiprion fabricii]|uniref:golgin subfamily A member 6-like protein 7 isoform X1 n=1 Tax=Neodiprion fabricii TaxID=2872261 RepID=UPI001ED8FA67|nr:golgin subfamily A member 6-like protein 7 isoform X1 [Neodiprion fabricii]